MCLGLVHHPRGHPGRPGPRRRRWVPTGAATAAANLTRGRGADFGLFNWWQGTLLMLAYGLVFAAVGSIILTRRDIT